MTGSALPRIVVLHAAVVAILLAAAFLLPDYHRLVVSRVLVLAVFAMGYNLLFGYVGLLSLGHAMFFSAGLYGAGMAVAQLGWGPAGGFLAGLGAGAVLAAIVGMLALRTSGVAFMIVTMMFAQVLYLTVLYFAGLTGGDEGFVLPQPSRQLTLGPLFLDLTQPTTRYLAALGLFSVVLVATVAIVRSGLGRVLIAIRENEERARILGYDAFANKLLAVILSGAICAAAGAAYALLFGYVGASFASVQYSILPLLWVLLGGAATTLGPLVGTLLMTYVVDWASSATSASLFFVGLALILSILFFPKGLLGSLRTRFVGWLP